MKKFSRLVLKFTVTLIIAFSIALSIHGGGKTHADSGYDTSYGGGSSYSGGASYSGGSSYSGSSYSSSSSNSSSYRSKSSSSSSSSSGSSDVSLTDLLITFGFIAVLVIGALVYDKIRTAFEGGRNSAPINVKSNQYAIKQLKQFIPGFSEQEFLQNGYKIYLDVQDAWTNFELNKVQNVITDELFNQYESQLSSMEIKGEQNIMKGFVLKNSAIMGCNKQNNNIEVRTRYVVEFYDYIINKETKAVLRGRNKRKVQMHYDLTFVMSASQNKVENCPNCGAKVDITSAGTCPYCGSKIVGENANWVLSKKLCVRQINL